MRRAQGRLFVLSAPSGSGKTTLCRELLKRCRGLIASISATTRPPRAGERPGRDYLFVSRARFAQMRRRGELLEWARVFTHLYGTPRAFVERHLGRGRDVILTIDVQGAAQVRRTMPHAVSIFVIPPSMRELKARLARRGTETTQVMARRLRIARQELRQLPHYDYAVVNETIHRAVRQLEAIVTAERCRVRRS